MCGRRHRRYLAFEDRIPALSPAPTHFERHFAVRIDAPFPQRPPHDDIVLLTLAADRNLGAAQLLGRLKAPGTDDAENVLGFDAHHDQRIMSGKRRVDDRHGTGNGELAFAFDQFANGVAGTRNLLHDDLEAGVLEEACRDAERHRRIASAVRRVKHPDRIRHVLLLVFSACWH
jgi:hypothetical protein